MYSLFRYIMTDVHLNRDAVQLFVYGGDFDTKDGTGCRDYIHIMDIARGHVAALKQVTVLIIFTFGSYIQREDTKFMTVDFVGPVLMNHISSDCGSQLPRC